VQKEALIMVNLNLNSIVSTLNKPKVGQIIGALASEYKLAQGLGTDFFGLINAQVQAAFKDPHLPSLESVIGELTGGVVAEVFQPAVKLAIVSWILKELNLHPQLTRYAKVGTNLGTNVAIGSALLATISHATIQHSSPRSGNIGALGNSETWKYQS